MSPQQDDFKTLLVEFRSAHARFDGADFSVYATPAGRLEDDLERRPLGFLSLQFPQSEVSKRVVDEIATQLKVKPETLEGPIERGFVVWMAAEGELGHECEAVFVELARRAGALLPGAVQMQLREFEPRGQLCIWWMAFLLTVAKKESLVTEVSGADFPVYMWRRPFAGSANAIELCGLIDSAAVSTVQRHGGDANGPERTNITYDSAADRGGRDDTTDDAEKKKQKRPMSAAASDCARLYKARLKGSNPATMKEIVEEYVETNGGSVSSIRRVLADNPDQWKSSKTTKTRQKGDNGRK